VEPRKVKAKGKVREKEAGSYAHIPAHSSPSPLKNIPSPQSSPEEQEYGVLLPHEYLLPHEFLLPYGTLPSKKLEIKEEEEDGEKWKLRRDSMKMRKGTDLPHPFYMRDSMPSISLEERAVLEDFKAILGYSLYPIIKERIVPCIKIGGFIVEKDRIVELWIYNCGLKELPESIGHLYALKRLILSKNGLEKVPSSMGKLENLEVLNLSANRLTSIPSPLESLLNLRELDLSENQFLRVPPFLGRLVNLEKLSLAGNRLEEVPIALGKLAILEELDLSSNNLGGNPASLGRLKKLRSLKKLDLADCQLGEVPVALGELPSLEDLDLCCNHLERLPLSLGERQTLKSLNLHGNKHLDFPEFLNRLPTLKNLSWGETLWGPNGGSEVESYLRKLEVKGIHVELIWDKRDEDQYRIYGPNGKILNDSD